MATEYISRDSVCLNKHVFYHQKDGIARNNGYDPADWAIRISDVMDVPAADVRPVVRAEWIKGGDGCEYCAKCKYDRCLDGYILNFCPNCGADMREV